MVDEKNVRKAFQASKPLRVFLKNLNAPFAVRRENRLYRRLRCSFVLAVDYAYWDECYGIPHTIRPLAQQPSH
jgi:hypothetical protein